MVVLHYMVVTWLLPICNCRTDAFFSECICSPTRHVMGQITGKILFTNVFLMGGVCGLSLYPRPVHRQNVQHLKLQLIIFSHIHMVNLWSQGPKLGLKTNI